MGSTTGLIEFVRQTDAQEVIVATDKGIFHKMKEVAGEKVIMLAPGLQEKVRLAGVAESVLDGYE